MLGRSIRLFAAIALGFLSTGSVSTRASEPSLQVAAPPSLAGAWQQEGHSVMLLATKTYVAFFGIEGLPALSTYTVNGDRITLQPSAGRRSFNDAILEDDLGIKASRTNGPIVLDRFEITATTMRLLTPDGITRSWKRLE